MLSIVICGTGRMGTLIDRTAREMRDGAGEPLFEVVAQIGFEVKELETAPAAEIIIDFSNVAALDAVAGYVRRTGAALVSGTTGYSDEQLAVLRELGSIAPVVWSGNYSIGIAALRHLVAQATRELPGFDIEIVETHHNQKADAPSARDTQEVGVHALRGGTVAGVHTVSFFGPSEEVSLTHRAESRGIFVNGALAAAQKLVVRDKGFYTFDEVMFG